MEEITGNVHSLESFGTVDGPGVRFVVFFQGCHLQCKYCHNRDTWKLSGGKPYTVAELMQIIQRFEPYFLPNGGVTLSGGEPLLQPDFVLALVRACKQAQYEVAIDTSGIIAITPVIQEIVQFADLFLLDIKSIREETCKWLSGVSNQKELAFANYLQEQGKRIWIRQVLLPGITDKEEDLLALRNFIQSLSCVEKVEILPYHDFGKYKWETMGVAYPLEGVPLPTEEEIERAKKIIGIR